MFYHGIGMCLHAGELMQIFPLTSAGLGFSPSLCITLEMLLMETTYFAIQHPKQSQVFPRLLPGAFYPCMSTATLFLPLLVQKKHVLSLHLLSLGML